MKVTNYLLLVQLNGVLPKVSLLCTVVSRRHRCRDRVILYKKFMSPTMNVIGGELDTQAVELSS